MVNSGYRYNAPRVSSKKIWKKCQKMTGPRLFMDKFNEFNQNRNYMSPEINGKPIESINLTESI